MKIKLQKIGESLLHDKLRKLYKHHLHIISHNAPYLLPQILHNLCFSFLLGITAVPREIGKEAYAKFWGGGGGGGGKLKVHYGSGASGVNERNDHLEIFFLSSINRKF